LAKKKKVKKKGKGEKTIGARGHAGPTAFDGQAKSSEALSKKTPEREGRGGPTRFQKARRTKKIVVTRADRSTKGNREGR